MSVCGCLFTMLPFPITKVEVLSLEVSPGANLRLYNIDTHSGNQLILYQNSW